jgi:multiple sugar transport system permease protein
MVKRRRLWVDILVGAFVLSLVALNILPIIWGVLASFKPESQLLSYPPTFLNFTPTLENYRLVLGGGFLTAVGNSVFYSFGAVAIGLFAGGLAAFGFDRFEFKGKESLFLLIVASIPLAIGAAALLVPNFLYFTALGLTNKWFTLPLIYGVYNLPMAIWIIKGSMETLPKELDEAAYIDGASSFTVFRKIVMPLCKPALGAAGLFLFIHAWNEFVAGSVMVDAKELKPVQVLVYQYIGFFGRDWGLLTAASTIAILPILVIYGFFGRLLISGLTRGATKG